MVPSFIRNFLLERPPSPSLQNDLSILAEIRFQDQQKPGPALSEGTIAATRLLVDFLLRAGLPEPCDLAPYEIDNDQAVVIAWKDPVRANLYFGLANNGVRLETLDFEVSKQWNKFKDGKKSLELILSVAQFVTADTFWMPNADDEE